MLNAGGGSAEAFIELDDLASAYCQKPDDVGWNEHLGPAYKLLMGPGRSLVRTVEIAAILMVIVALALCIGYWSTEHFLLAWAAGATVTVFGALLLWHQRPSPRPRQLIVQSGDQATNVGLFLRFYAHLKNGAIVAYQRPRPGGAGEYRRVNVGFWRASYGWLGMLGGASRWYSVERVEHPLFVSKSNLEIGPVASELWLCRAAASPESLSGWPAERLEALERLLVDLIGPDSTVSNAFMILRLYKEELSIKQRPTSATEAVAKRLKSQVNDHRGSTADNVIRGKSKGFNRRLLRAVEFLLSSQPE